MSLLSQVPSNVSSVSVAQMLKYSSVLIAQVLKCLKCPSAQVI